MRKAFRLSLAPLLLLLAAPAAADEIPLRFERLSVEDGLSHGAVYSITQDSMGFLWFATEDGLNRWDGRRFKILRHRASDPNSLASSNFGKVLRDRDGTLWFGTWGAGLDHYDPKTGIFTHYRHDPENPTSLPQDRVEFLFVAADGALWVGSEEHGVARLNRETGEFQRFGTDQGIRHREVKAICQLYDDRLLVGGNGGMDVWVPEDERFIPYRYGPDGPGAHRIRTCMEDQEGDLWIGTRGDGLLHLAPDGALRAHYRPDPSDPASLSDDSVSAVLEDSYGRIWVGTYLGGLNLLDRDRGTFRTARYDPRFPESLNNDRVETLFEDHGGILWIGTRGSGLAKLDLKPRKFRNHLFDPIRAGNLPHPTVRWIVEEPASQNEEVWIATDGAGVALCEHRPGSCEVFSPDRLPFLETGRTTALLRDSKARLWIGTYEGGLSIGRIDLTGEQPTILSQGRTYRHDAESENSLPSDRVHVILENRRGEFWVGTDAGLAFIRGSVEDPLFERFPVGVGDPQGLSHVYVTSLLEDEQNDLWIGTRRGLNLYRVGQNRFEQFLADTSNSDALQDDNVFSLVEDGERRILWVGTEAGGLHSLNLNTKRFRAYRMEDGLPSNVISGILQTAEGDDLWLSTSRGISRFDPVTERFRNYFADGSGLRNHSYMRGSALRTSSGMMYFGGIAGMTAFHPQAVYENPHPPPIVLTDVKVYGKSRNFGRPLLDVQRFRIEPHENFLTLEFAGLDYTVPSQNTYRYLLEGVDPDWVEAGPRNFVTYNNLNPGVYQFTARAANNDGLWSEDALRLEVEVLPPFWETVWFRGFVIGAAALLLWGGHRTRVGFIRRRAEELESINTELHEQIQERRRAQQEREQLIDVLQEKNEEVQQLTYAVSHDLKSPLVTVKGFLGMLEMDLKKGKPERVASDMEHIRLAVDQMQLLLDDLLELSRIGKITSKVVDVDFDTIAREAVEIVRGQVIERGVDVVIHPSETRVLGDRPRLVQLLQNLVDNAIKFLGDQAEPRVEIGRRGEDESGRPIFYVADNGVGIAPEHQAKVFQVFERLQTDQKGSGIGLAAVKRIVADVHDGRVWLESEGEGRGTTFFFTLAAASETDAGSEPTEADSNA